MPVPMARRDVIGLPALLREFNDHEEPRLGLRAVQDIVKRFGRAIGTGIQMYKLVARMRLEVPTALHEWAAGCRCRSFQSVVRCPI